MPGLGQFNQQTTSTFHIHRKTRCTKDGHKYPEDDTTSSDGEVDDFVAVFDPNENVFEKKGSRTQSFF